MSEMNDVENFFKVLGYERIEDNSLKGKKTITFKNRISEKDLKIKLRDLYKEKES